MSLLKNVVVFACNEGGHFSQMMCLSPLFPKYKSFLITDNINISKNDLILLGLNNVYYAMGIAEKRRKLSMSKKIMTRWSYFSGYIKMFNQCFILWLKLRPKVIISTGSNLAVPLFLLGHIFGSKTVYIESRAKVKSKNLTGKILQKFCNKILVQWPEMLEVYGNNAEYKGILY